MHSVIEDIQFAWRNAIKKPAIALLIVITFGLGIGANSAIFSVVYHVILAPLPYTDGERLVRLQQHQPAIGTRDFGSSVQTFFDIRESSDSLEEVLEYHSMQFTLLGHGDPLRVQTGVVSWNYFDVLGIRPVLGRSFVEGEDVPGAEPLILLSHRYWLSHFGGDQDIIGRSLEMNNAVHTVIGVLPPIPAYPVDNDIYIAAASCPFRASEGMINNRRPGMLTLFGKLKDGVSLQQGSLELNNLAGQLAAQYPDAYPSNEGYAANLVSLKDEMIGDSAPTFYLLLAIAGLVMLIACTNVANLNLARLASRTQELAIREALGAKPARIARQLLTESTLFALAGGLLGLLLAYPSLNLLSELAAGYTPLSSEVEMDSTILLFSLALSLATGVISGSAAAFNRRNISNSLKEGGDKVTTTSSGKRLRSGLLVVQFALSFVILTTSALVTTSLYRLNNQDGGFDADKVLVTGLDLNFTNYSTRLQVQDFTRQLLADIRQIPGVELASVAGSFPLASNLAGPVPFQTESQALADSDSQPRASVTVASEDFHQVLGIPLLQGRLFQATDDENAPPVALVNQSLAQSYFGGASAVGQRISVDNGQNWIEIVGVVGDVRATGLDQAAGDSFYVPFMQRVTGGLRLLVKSAGDPAALRSIIAQTVHQIDPQQAIASSQTMDQIRDQWLAAPRLVAMLIGLFGLLALIITLSGVVGVVSYNVSQRVREIGVRLAVGASPRAILNMLLLQGSKMTMVGLVIGLATMAFVIPVFEGFLFQTNPFDPAIYISCFVLLFGVSMLAMVAPAQQAARLEPTRALRDE
jgi:predicted permease